MREPSVFLRYIRGIPFMRELLSGFAFAVLARGLGYINTLLLVKLALPYIGPDIFGDVVAAMSFGLCFPLFDLGFGHAMINRFASNDCDKREREVLLSSAVAGSIILAVFLLALLLIGSLALANSLPIHASHWIIVYATFTVSIPFAVINKAQYGARQYSILFGFNTVHQIIAMILLLLGTHYRVRSEWILASQVVPNLVTNAASAAVFLRTTNTQINIRAAKCAGIVRCMRMGMAPFIAQFSAMIIWAAPTILIATLSSRTDASIYYVLSRVSMPMVIATTLLTQPMWSMFANFQRKNDKRGRDRLLAFALVAVIVLNAIYFATAWALRRQITAHLGISLDELPSGLLIAVTAMTLLMCLRNPLAMAVHGSGLDRVLSLAFLVSLIYPLVLLPLRITSTDPTHVLGGFAGVEIVLILVCLATIPRTLASTVSDQ